MSHRKFADRDGTRWEVRVSSKHEWRFDPVPGNPRAPRRARPPLYAGDDPFELSERELQSILGNATPNPKAGRETPDASPFGDVYEPRRKKSPFLDDLAEDD
ncbi:MAG: hypothetical protein F4X23_00450 [Gemmatimonadales bacterium]|nr:hypothetical protein [Gemmatimonadales bacterium]